MHIDAKSAASWFDTNKRMSGLRSCSVHVLDASIRRATRQVHRQYVVDGFVGAVQV